MTDNYEDPDHPLAWMDEQDRARVRFEEAERNARARHEDYDATIQQAMEKGLISNEDGPNLRDPSNDPAEWAYQTAQSRLNRALSLDDLYDDDA